MKWIGESYCFRIQVISSQTWKSGQERWAGPDPLVWWRGGNGPPYLLLCVTLRRYPPDRPYVLICAAAFSGQRKNPVAYATHVGWLTSGPLNSVSDTISIWSFCHFSFCILKTLNSIFLFPESLETKFRGSGNKEKANWLSREESKSILFHVPWWPFFVLYLNSVWHIF